MFAAPAALRSAQAAASAPAAKADLPDAVNDAISDRFSGWTLAPTVAAPACADGSADTRAIMTGDFDGDGHADVALRLESQGTPHLVVVLTRVVTPVLYELPMPQGGISQPLRILKAGTRYRTQGMSVADYLGTDALASNVCGAAGEIWMWTGTGFEKQPLVAPQAGGVIPAR